LGIMSAQIIHTSCPECNQMFEVRVERPLNPLMVLDYIARDLGGKCKKCWEAGKRFGSGDALRHGVLDSMPASHLHAGEPLSGASPLKQERD
jgi:hypothetical protein